MKRDPESVSATSFFRQAKNKHPHKPKTKMDAKFRGLPPLKRLRLIQQQQELQNQQNHHNPMTHDDDEEGTVVSGSTLPAKKRKKSRNSNFLPDPPVSISANAYSLPAKKRVWALQPDFASNLDVSPIDLNAEYKPPFDEEAKKAENDEPNIGTPLVAEKLHESEDRDADDDNDDDDGIVCDVCQSTDGDPSDPIVFCDGCAMVKGIPEGDWV